ncbi:MAG: PAS domain-containing protein [Methylovirgula sp.]
MRHRAARELFDYWNALRGSRPAPERAEIDLAAIRGLIADMFMLEVDAADLFPFVLSGTRVNALACTEQHGRSFLDLWARQEQRNVAALLLAVIDSACPLIAVADAKPAGWQDHEIELLLLPLGRRGQDRTRILGLIAPSTPPSWLGLLPVQDLTLRSVQTIDNAAPSNAFDPEILFKTAPVTPQAHGFGKPLRNVLHLRVFQGGRHVS